MPAQIRDAMEDLKKSGQAVGAQVLTNLAGFAPPTILSQAARLQARQRFFNLVVTNVPGPQFPLYVLGRRLEVLYPVVPLAQRQALGIAVMSYDGHLGFGLLADYDALPEPRGDRARPAAWRSPRSPARRAFRPGVQRLAPQTAPPADPGPRMANHRARPPRGQQRSLGAHQVTLGLPPLAVSLALSRCELLVHMPVPLFAKRENLRWLFLVPSPM